LTVPQIGELLARMLNRCLNCHSPEYARRTTNRRLRRNEEARLYHWRKRNRLPPRRFEQRT
jgi:nitrate reductase cytochrome c-type subunit